MGEIKDSNNTKVGNFLNHYYNSKEWEYKLVMQMIKV